MTQAISLDFTPWPHQLPSLQARKPPHFGQVTMELPAAAASSTGGLMLMGIGQ